MPFKPPRVCQCGKVVAAGVLCACQLERQRERKARADANRPNASQRGYDARWRRESKEFLALPENRMCACGCGRFADMIDHKNPHRGDKRKFWDKANWQPLASSPCHASKKQRQEARNE